MAAVPFPPTTLPQKPGLTHLWDGYNHLSLSVLEDIRVLCSKDLHLIEETAEQNAASNFFDFPAQLGLEFNEFDEPEANENWSEQAGPTKKEVSRIIQRWLFFQLLREVLGCVRGFQYFHFVHNGYVSTEYLPRYIEEWCNMEKTSAGPDRTRRFAHTQRVLDHARNLVSKYCSVDNAKDNSIWPVDKEISLSIMVLGETLTKANISIQQEHSFEIRGWHNHDYSSQGWGFSKAALLKVEEAGWCPKAIRLLQGLLRQNTTGLLYLLSVWGGTAPGRDDHRDCKADRCIIDTPLQKVTNTATSAVVNTTSSVAGNIAPSGAVDEPAYVLRHEDEFHHVNRSCRTEGACQKRLAEIIDGDGIPLLEYYKDKGELKVVPYSPSEKAGYVVISHVWSDGFGNRKENKMNICVLDMFHDMFKNIQTTESLRPTRFWIDTLAIPVHGDYQRQHTKAVGMMHKIYENATYTVVLDKTLMSEHPGHGAAKRAMKITMSPWMRRLWTLQEAVFSRAIYFEFLKETVSLDTLEKSFRDIRGTETLYSCIPEVARGYYNGLLGEYRGNRISGSRNQKLDATFLATVWKATQWRTTTHLNQETLALAILFDLDTEKFAVPEDSREKLMCNLLDLLTRSTQHCPIPSGIIFVSGPWINVKTYGWAPQTWLGGSKIDSPDPFASSIEQKATFDPYRGLKVSFPGFKLHNIGSHSRPLNTFKHVHFPINSLLTEWYTIEPADGAHFPANVQPGEQPKNLAIIMPRFPVQTTKEIALLVSIKSELEGLYCADILCRVWVSPIRESERRDSEKLREMRTNFHRGNQDNHFLGEQLDVKQEWVVDRRPKPKPKEHFTRGTGPPNGQDDDSRINSFRKTTRAMTDALSGSSRAIGRRTVTFFTSPFHSSARKSGHAAPPPSRSATAATNRAEPFQPRPPPTSPPS